MTSSQSSPEFICGLVFNILTVAINLLGLWLNLRMLSIHSESLGSRNSDNPNSLILEKRVDLQAHDAIIQYIIVRPTNQYNRTPHFTNERTERVCMK